MKHFSQCPASLLKPMQCRAGRALLDLDQAELAKAANVHRNTIADFEKGKRTPNLNNLIAIQGALESAGVVLIDEGAQGVGVKLLGA
ncbi:XRE family transcriptional regulator [Mesorhizobium sp. M7A.F.Ca.CA.001.09.2.1]|uniref:Helix-turn-helix domain-containing protein n=1 Tax=Mesorhizobium ciceri TaxID=39645 RepID=A0AB38T6Z1_9HYPH|nr:MULTISPECIES: helix-turn-helix transcriptional regulator [Mesorhizobium]RUY42725.1 XRE family transcriptional regulator [Mesorhizobium sp. M7A.F.Ca.CA.001.13.2.1]MDF3217961.1 helix-turn-helix transcriptional regulator [Mesorhizobium ciceri]RUY66880.1 XRE family transcriptional regulator [Mesorhizobium sp. M7A.F.Ca.CA.001.13.1.1]RUY72931.1 XRE family transcriptional regulator [Mesorhizobium sp. M7A.F.Ca.CA.001.05.1.1]RUY76608.1 XRE family transcriptional regulator [Mesorhizobium sp. M7A.F.Ca